MAYATFLIETVWRYTETSTPTGTTDLLITRTWVDGADLATRKTNAVTQVNKRFQNMLTGTAPNRTATVLSQSQTATR